MKSTKWMPEDRSPMQHKSKRKAFHKYVLRELNALTYDEDLILITIYYLTYLWPSNDHVARLRSHLRAVP